MNPGLLAAKHAPSVAAATSLLVNWLCAYRFDGKTVVSIHGVLHVEVENWQYACPRSPVEGGDCDNSATKAKAMLQTIADAPGDVINRIQLFKVDQKRNCALLHGGPWHRRSDEQRGFQSARTEYGAGTRGWTRCHVYDTDITTPTRSRERYAKCEDGVVDVPAVMDASLKALFPSEITDTLPLSRESKFASWEDTSHSTAMMAFANDLHPLASEGTSWTSPAMYMEPGKDRADVEAMVVADNAAFKLLGPNIGVGLKILHVGGQDSENPHRFISPGIVELTLGSKSALWTDPTLRKLGAACSQLVLSPSPNTAGVTPRGAWEGNYGAIPLFSADEDKASILDFASAKSRMDVLPPRAGVYQLSEFDTQSLKRSLDFLTNSATPSASAFTKVRSPTHTRLPIY